MKQKVSFVFRWTKGLQRKAESFCIRYFWRTKRKSTETITERCFPCQNKSVCQNLARSCKKWKSAKIRYTPFLHEALQFQFSVTTRPQFAHVYRTGLWVWHSLKLSNKTNFKFRYLSLWVCRSNGTLAFLSSIIFKFLWVIPMFWFP